MYISLQSNLRRCIKSNMVLYVYRNENNIYVLETYGKLQVTCWYTQRDQLYCTMINPTGSSNKVKQHSIDLNTHTEICVTARHGSYLYGTFASNHTTHTVVQKHTHTTQRSQGH